MSRRFANCYVAVEIASDLVAGYYILSSTSLPMTGLPGDAAKRLSRYPFVPAVLIGRSAVDSRFQGRKLGSALLADATQRVAAIRPQPIASPVNAKDEAAAAFYRHHGFEPVLERPLTLFVPMATAVKSLLD